jgi:hypothetical protein
MLGESPAPESHGCDRVLNRIAGVVNVGLFYNTFRVLGPAFDGRSQTTSTRKDGMESWGPSALLDKGYASSFRRSVRASRMSIREKVTKFHLPLPVTTSKKDSVYSERGLLVSSSRGGNSYGATGYGRTLSKPPSRSMDKVEALAYSSSSPQQAFPADYPFPRHIRTPSYEPSPFSDPRSARHHPSPSVGSAGSWSSSNSSSPLSAGSSLPPRQLALLASRSGSPRMSPPASREGSPRPLLLGQLGKDERYYVDPRTPPSPPTAISRLR